MITTSLASTQCDADCAPMSLTTTLIPGGFNSFGSANQNLQIGWNYNSVNSNNFLNNNQLSLNQFSEYRIRYAKASIDSGQVLRNEWDQETRTIPGQQGQSAYLQLELRSNEAQNYSIQVCAIRVGTVCNSIVWDQVPRYKVAYVGEEFARRMQEQVVTASLIRSLNLGARGVNTIDWLLMTITSLSTTMLANRVISAQK